MRELRIEVPGPCVPKARPRVVTGRSGRTRAVTPERTRNYERHVRVAAGAAAFLAGWRTLEGVVHVRVVIRQKDRRRRDVDNQVKSLLDGIQRIAFRDDSQVTQLEVGSVVDRDNPGATVWVRAVDQAAGGDA